MVLYTHTHTQRPEATTIQHIVDFLARHLDQFGDDPEDIRKAIEYSLSPSDSGKGGFVMTARDNDRLVGAVVVNETGMEGYIPENILVYIAVHQDSRGKGLGKMLMEKALHTACGSVALHVEPDNPAVGLYRKLGFTNKYLEMRYVPSTTD
jgi:ribosomal protein S18 acetylase RimI-like enzyme